MDGFSRSLGRNLSDFWRGQWWIVGISAVWIMTLDLVFTFVRTVAEILRGRNLFFAYNFASILHKKLGNIYWKLNLSCIISDRQKFLITTGMSKSILWSSCNFTENSLKQFPFITKNHKKVKIWIFCEIWQIFWLSLRMWDRYSFHMRHSQALYSVNWRNYSKRK